MGSRIGRLVFIGTFACLLPALSTCTFYASYSSKYFPCDENGDCPYGNCVCFNNSVCVPPDDQGLPDECWPCESVEDCSDSDNCTVDTCVAGKCQHSAVTDPDCVSCVDDQECDDGNPHTSDSCLPEGICQNLVVTDPVCLEPLGTVPSLVGGMGQSITANESYVYLGLSEAFHGVQIVDVSDPADYKPRGVFNTDDDPANLGVSRSDVLGLDVSESFLYLATYRGGLVILDVSNPDAPAFKGGLFLGSENWGVFVAGELAYLARHGGLEIIDVSDKHNPASIGSIGLQDRTQDVHVIDHLAYVASWNHFQVVDVSDPTQPALLSDLDTVEMAYEVWTRPEGYAYLALKVPRKLLVVDATDPENPLVCYESEAGESEYRGIDGWENKIFLATGTDGASGGGVRVYDVQDPCQPVFESEAPADGPVFEVKAVNGRVYAAIVDGALIGYEMKLDCP